MLSALLVDVDEKEPQKQAQTQQFGVESKSSTKNFPNPITEDTSGKDLSKPQKHQKVELQMTAELEVAL